MDDGPTAVTDADIDATLRRQARTVYVRSLISAVVLTGVVLAIPMRG